MTIPTDLFSEIPHDTAEEIFQTLVAAKNVRIERIVSHGQASPDGFWYDQNQDEWVLLLQGAARLQLEGEPPIELIPGNHIQLHFFSNIIS